MLIGTKSRVLNIDFLERAIDAELSEQVHT